MPTVGVREGNFTETEKALYDEVCLFAVMRVRFREIGIHRDHSVIDSVYLPDSVFEITMNPDFSKSYRLDGCSTA